MDKLDIQEHKVVMGLLLSDINFSKIKYLYDVPSIYYFIKVILM